MQHGLRVRRYSARRAALVLLGLGLSLASYACSDDPVVTPPPAKCAQHADCDDKNPCTIDSCFKGQCRTDPTPQGFACGAGKCAGETCDGHGACAKGAPIDVDDGLACTTDACDPATIKATHTAIANCLEWKPLATEGAPTARENHSIVWTGDAMIVWGGATAGKPSLTSTGAIYDEAKGSWRATSTKGAPEARHFHAAAWTGSKMIVWGGYAISGYAATGGLYDPKTDTWTPMSTTGAPAGRTGFASAWTGKELVVWGGEDPNLLGDGGRYDPATDTWTALPAAGAPTPRYDLTGVWTGDRVIVWGGNDKFDLHKDGASFDPVASTWTATDFAGAPPGREAHSAVWTGTEMMVFGGFNGGYVLGDGGSLAIQAGAMGTWSILPVMGAPAARQDHLALWLGDRAMLIGGCGNDACMSVFGDGAFWKPGANGGSWTPIAESPGLSARRGARGVWTGKSALVWGGRDAKGVTGTGAELTL